MKEAAASISGSLGFLVQSFHLGGHWGWLTMTILFMVSAVSVVPRPMLCVLAGSAYGLYGVPIALTGSTAGAVAAFLLGSTLKSTTARFVFDRWPVSQLVCNAIREEGWRIVLLCRLSPLAPSSVQSLLFGASSIAFTPFALATIVGILPGITLEVTLGAAARDALNGRLSNLQIGLFITGLCAGFAALMIVGRRLREALRTTVAMAPQGREPVS